MSIADFHFSNRVSVIEPALLIAAQIKITSLLDSSKCEHWAGHKNIYMVIP